MKRFLFLVTLVFGFALASQAQTAFVSQYSKALDTVTNTATKYMTIPTPLNSFYKTAEISVTYTKISGTVAGTVALEYSIDGTNYYSLTANAAATATDVASQTFGWSLKDVGFRYIRLKFTGTGTMSAQVKGMINARKQNS
ncbi:hypothetical protein [Chitinophaga rhizosphaerae]|uniref:hypothetical protein n=1 Tax=Chitinophaga rhizosphaerae TaxID=1864947 RepID=UPI000F812C33|nr:hypothetical protein [Chitinophaga rhizosphaerae]